MASVRFSPADDRTLAALGLISWQTYPTKLWDVNSGEVQRTTVGCFFAVFSPDGRTIATSGSHLVAGDPEHCDVLLVNATTGALRLRMAGGQDLTLCASFSVDGSKLASGSQDGACKVWDSSTGALLRTIELGSCISSLTWGRDWVQDTQRSVAFAMGLHPRLGAGSRVLALDEELLRMILDRVSGAGVP